MRYTTGYPLDRLPSSLVGSSLFWFAPQISPHFSSRLSHLVTPYLVFIRSSTPVGERSHGYFHTCHRNIEEWLPEDVSLAMEFERDCNDVYQLLRIRGQVYTMVSPDQVKLFM
ncbi:hypothetical protein ACMD2_17289 [Ananas comosus]|uniref:Uncharacterized protein n=1 Tax=Ananas comosus TaxID=4615 RepID=A0A199UXX4_ANACO|nr:hypothetical protein ACMD2_17289 [Ananas comosus]